MSRPSPETCPPMDPANHYRHLDHLDELTRVDLLAVCLHLLSHESAFRVEELIDSNRWHRARELVRSYLNDDA